MIRFGPSGNSQSFYDEGFKSSVQMPGWLKDMGLNAYEYSCSKGINIGRKTAEDLGDRARENNIFLSIHAPYYINLASDEPEKREKSIQYIIKTLEAASWMGAGRIVVHTGSCSKVDRRWALDTSIEAMREAIARSDDMGYGNINVCPEVLGKMNQLGSLDEILEICAIDERLIPTLDFGHLHARHGGNLNSTEDFDRVLNRVEDALGNERLKHIHIHFSRIEFTAGGEKRHRTLSETEFGPEFEYLAIAIKKKNMEPVIICESRGNMAEDALKLKEIYSKICQM
ncbi:MAG TPA: TIM barrel protein [Clostridiales bacterium]|nr:TIM barrel protein [Clostridiales bacterium]